MSAVDAAIAEIDASLSTISPQYEGLHDYVRLNLQPETLKVVQAALVAYDRRVGLLATVRDLLGRLRDDGHPNLSLPQVSGAVYADLQAQETTIAAALAQFASDPATSLGLAAQPAEDK